MQCNSTFCPFVSSSLCVSRQFQLVGSGFKKELQKRYRGTKKLDEFPKPALNMTAIAIGMALANKTKNPQFGQAAISFLKSISGGMILSLTEMHETVYAYE